MGRTGLTPSGPARRELLSKGDLISESADQRKTNEGLSITPDWILSGAELAMPTAGYANRIYIVTDATKKIYLDDGTNWVQIV